MTDHVEYLKSANEWRRGSDIEMPHPKLLGEAIDAAIAEIERLRKIEEAAKELIRVGVWHGPELAGEKLIEACK